MALIDETHDPARKSWVASADNHPEFPIQNLPFGVFRRRDSTEAGRVGVAIGDEILDVSEVAALLPGEAAGAAAACAAPCLNALMALGPAAWSALRRELSRLLSADERANRAAARAQLVPMAQAELLLPVKIPDFTDFYASVFHATNAGRMFRPDNPLLPNYKYVPVAYHSRASSVRVSGEPVRRPRGQTKPQADAAPAYRPARSLDYELELGFYIGVGSEPGATVPVGEALDHVFGVCLLNDWSARDIQAWEYQPLGPFQSKAFATTISPWIVTQAALEPFRCAGAERDHPLLPYLREERPGLYDLTVGWTMNGQPMGKTNYNVMYYSSAQQLAHHTESGCPMRVGDLLGSGTISGPTRDQTGALLEMTQGGKNPVNVKGEERIFIEDGDEIGLYAYARGDGYRIGFGPCTGRILPAKE